MSFAVQELEFGPVVASGRRGGGDNPFILATLTKWSTGAVQPKQADCFVVPQSMPVLF